MTLKDMAYLLVIEEEKSITKAANRLFVAQPALSLCVQRLEKELDISIFSRSSSGVIATEEGYCFLDFARQTLQQYQDLKQRLSDLKNEQNNHLSMGFTGTQAAYVLPHILPPFKIRHPELNVELIEASSQEIEEKLLRGEVDIGIIHPPIVCEELKTFELSYDEMVIVPRVGSRFQPHIYYQDGPDGMSTPYLNVEFLRDEPLIMTAPGQRSRMVIDEIFRRANIQPNIKQLSKNLCAVDALVQVNYGSAILPRKQVSPYLARRGFFCIDSAVNIPYTFHVAVLRSKYQFRAMRRMLEFLWEIRDTF